MLLSSISDIRIRKIKNAIVLPFIAAGLVTNWIISGHNGLTGSLLGAFLPLVLLMALYALKMLGAGDIKLFSAVGAIMGTGFVLYSMAYSFLVGGIISIVLMILRKNAAERFKYLMNYLKSCFLTFSIKPYAVEISKDDSAEFPFACAIALGTIIQAVIELN